jgi:hypothetical protein
MSPHEGLNVGRCDGPGLRTLIRHIDNAALEHGTAEAAIKASKVCILKRNVRPRDAVEVVEVDVLRHPLWQTLNLTPEVFGH